MANIFLGIGHGGKDFGASSNGLVEKNINLVVGLECNRVLVEHGVRTLMSRYVDENDDISSEIAECNYFSPDYAVDIHNNSGGGDGFEAFYHYRGGQGLQLAKAIESEVIAIGQNSRGCKTKLNSQGTDYFGFIRQTNCPAIIVECAFIDSDDRFIIDEISEQKLFGVAIAKGILKQLGIPYKGQEQVKPSIPTPSGTGWRVCIGYYKDYNNAQAQKEKAIEKGFDGTYLVPYAD